MKALRAALAALLVCTTARAQPAPCESSNESICLPKPDFQRFLTIALERQCLERHRPTFEIDRVVILTDSDGRVFHTGADPASPYKLKMSWCHYEIEAAGTVNLVAAIKTSERSGFRFRPKAYLSHLPLKLSKGSFNEGIDAGILIDWLFIEWVNFNFAAGFRSVGAGLGFDLTQNFGIYAGYGIGWTAPLHNINAGLYFAF